MSSTLQPLLRLLAPMSRPDPSRPEHMTNQDVLRALGAWLDIRGYTLLGVRRDGVDLVVEAGMAGAETPDVLRFDVDALSRLAAASRSDRDRDDRPPIYPIFG